MSTVLQRFPSRLPLQQRPVRPKVGLLVLLAACCVLAACGTRPTQGGLVDKALKLVGLETVEVPKELKAVKEAAVAPAAPTRIPLRIHSGSHLNSPVPGRSLSLVVKLYKLKSYEDFVQLPYDAFTQPQLGSDDVIATRELVLLPGQHYEVDETLPPGTTHLGVVALFAAPQEARWRFVFETQQSATHGITLGAHRCALSVAQGVPVGSSPEALRLAGTTCR